MLKRVPLFKVIAIIQIALLAHRHLRVLTPRERRRLGELCAARIASTGPSGASCVTWR